MRSYSVLVYDTSQLISFLETLAPESPNHYLIQLFSTDDHQIAQGYSSLISQRVPAATIIGHSARHVIHEGKVQHTGTLIVSFMFHTYSIFSSSSISLKATASSIAVS